MDWRFVLGLASAAVALLAIAPYIHATLYGTTRPNIITWSVWTLNGVILSTAQYASGASWTLATLAGMTLATGVISVLAWPYGQRRYGWLDAACFGLAIIAIIGWSLTSDPMVAIWLAIAAEFGAIAPTIRKAYLDPNSETASTYWLNLVATAMGIAASTKFDAANLAFPIFALVSSAVVATLAMRRNSEVLK